MSDLRELERQLQTLSHSTDALQTVRDFSQTLKKTRRRQEVFNAPGALLVRPPITFESARERELIAEEEDPFVLLQGDLIQTDAAYFMGTRLTGMRFLIANSTCDLVPGRREYVALLPVLPIETGGTDEEDANVAALLAELLKFTQTRRMYLPLLADDEENVLANAVEFDRIAQARLEDVLVADRIASLSLVGWRIFGSHLRGILTRAGESEVVLRTGWPQQSGDTSQ